MGTSEALCWLGNSHSLARTFMALSPTLNLRGQVLFYFFYLPAPIYPNNNTHPHRHRNRRERTQGIMGEWMPEALSVPGPREPVLRPWHRTMSSVAFFLSSSSCSSGFQLLSSGSHALHTGIEFPINFSWASVLWKLG